MCVDAYASYKVQSYDFFETTLPLATYKSG